jgi:hypothetical protein
MKTHYPPTYVIENDNPTDVIGGAGTDDYRYAIKRFTDDPHIDIIMPWFVFQDEPLEEKIIYYLGEFSEQGRKPLLVGENGGPYTNKFRGSSRNTMFPYTTTSETGLQRQLLCTIGACSIIRFLTMKTTISRAICCSILLFNIWKEQKHAEIEREFQNIPYF